jgi:DNA-directed RNA polymerase specialized sigma subunit
MSDINNEAVVEQIAEALAEELDREPTNAEIANEVERREGWIIDAVDVGYYLDTIE